MSETLLLLDRARAYTKEAESLFCNNYPIPAMNEFRNVAYHLAEYIRDKANIETVRQAYNHAKKAYLDANEAYAIALLDSVKTVGVSYNGYSDIVAKMLPSYKGQKQSVIKLQQILRTAPADTFELRFERAKKMEVLFPIVKGFMEDLETFKSAIQDAIRKSKDITKQWVVGMIIAFVTALFCALLGFLN